MTSLKNYLLSQSQSLLTADSRKLSSNSIYFALPGPHYDGHEFLEAATKAAVQAVVVQDDHKMQVQKYLEDFTGKIFFVPDTKRAWAQAWRRHCENPDEQLYVIGLTGTNGKTSMAHMVKHILTQADQVCGVMGTIDHHVGNKVWKTQLTTPGADVLYPRLQDFVRRGANACALEISSHGLAQKRNLGLQINVAVFSNLTSDHLDYHKNMQAYFEAKNLLFTSLLHDSAKANKVAVINYMDPWAQRLQVPKGVPTYRILEKNSKQAQEVFKSSKPSSQTHYVLIDIQETNLHGSRFEIEILEKDQTSQKISLHLPVIGSFQVYNWVEAMMSVWSHLNKKSEFFIKAAKSFQGVPGRMQKVLADGVKASVFVDYAHTPDALKRSLQSLKNLKSSGSIHLVFGCGGDRDQQKRPEMARVAQDYADHIIITNDNPRTEDPQQIADQILQGFSKDSVQPDVILDRQKAIRKACVDVEQTKGVVLIAGKGHEDYQILGHNTIAFSDFDQVVEIYKNKS